MSPSLAMSQLPCICLTHCGWPDVTCASVDAPLQELQRQLQHRLIASDSRSLQATQLQIQHVSQHFPRPTQGSCRYKATRLHFHDLVARYGKPLVVLNLVKSAEKHARETLLRKEYERAIQYLNKQARSLLGSSFRDQSCRMYVEWHQILCDLAGLSLVLTEWVPALVWADPGHWTCGSSVHCPCPTSAWTFRVSNAHSLAGPSSSKLCTCGPGKVSGA